MNPGTECKFEQFLPLYFTSKPRHKDMLICLLEAGAFIYVKDSKGRTELHYAAAAGQSQIVQSLLSRGGDMLDKDKDGNTLLHLAVQERKTEIASLLLALQKNNILEAKDVYGLSALHQAIRLSELCGSDFLEIMRLLLEHGANPNSRNYLGRSAIQESAKYENGVAYILLRQYGGGPGIQKPIIDATWTPLRAFMSEVFRNGRRATIKLHISAYSKIDGFLIRGKTEGFDAGGMLYSHINSYITDHVCEVASAAACLPDDSLLEFYCREWGKYKKAAKRIGHVSRSLSRHWVPRVKDEGRTEVYEIEQLHYVLWRKNFFDVDKRIIPRVRFVLENPTAGDINTDISIKTLCLSFDCMGLTVDGLSND